MARTWMGTALTLVLTGAICERVSSADDAIDFGRDVQPLFKAHCYECHGPKQQKNGFRLDRRRDALRGGTITMIGPGNSAGSRFYLKLVTDQYGPQMPPTGPLDPEQLNIIKLWIDQGAKWPDDLAGETVAAPPDPKAARMMELLRDGDLRAFKTMLSEDPRIARLNGPSGSTPLMYAVLYGDADAVRLVLDRCGLPARDRIPSVDAARRRIVVCEEPFHTVSTVLRERLSARTRPVGLRGGDQLGRHGARGRGRAVSGARASVSPITPMQLRQRSRCHPRTIRQWHPIAIDLLVVGRYRYAGKRLPRPFIRLCA